MTRALAKGALETMFREGTTAAAVIAALGPAQSGGGDELAALADRVVAENPDKVAGYRGGKVKLFEFFVGQVMRASGGRANPDEIRRLLKERLDQLNMACPFRLRGPVAADLHRPRCAPPLETSPLAPPLRLRQAVSLEVPGAMICPRCGSRLPRHGLRVLLAAACRRSSWAATTASRRAAKSSSPKSSNPWTTSTSRDSGEPGTRRCTSVPWGARSGPGCGCIGLPLMVLAGRRRLLGDRAALGPEPRPAAGFADRNSRRGRAGDSGAEPRFHGCAGETPVPLARCGRRHARDPLRRPGGPHARRRRPPSAPRRAPAA